MNRAHPGNGGTRMSRHTGRLLVFLLLGMLSASSTFADDSLTSSGQLRLRGVDARYDDSVQEPPSLTGRLVLDAIGSAWRFHSWIEGGWDGTAHDPAQHSSLLKSFNKVYQNNSPFLEFKELALSHTAGNLDLRMGIQRFAWGRLDEYPPNDLLNPWDYTRFLVKPIEDRKIGVPSLAATLRGSDWSYDAVWIPFLVPYRFPVPAERWFGRSAASALSRSPTVEFTPREPDLPPRTIANGNIALRARHTGDIDWAVSLYHGYDPRPVFKTTTFVVTQHAGRTVIDPGYVPDFHKITALGVDGAGILGDLSIRAEAVYIANRHFNIREELWGYPLFPRSGSYSLNPIGAASGSLDYGVGADYRLFEEALLTVQLQQTFILDRPETLYARQRETVLWAHLRVGLLNQKVETTVGFAYNPEHGDSMAKANVWYLFSDAWKAGLSGVTFTGPSQSIFGRYAKNDELGAELVYSW